MRNPSGIGSASKNFYEKWHANLVDISKISEIFNLNIAFEQLPSGIAQQKDFRLRIAEKGELTALVIRKISSIHRLDDAESDYDSIREFTNNAESDYSSREPKNYTNMYWDWFWSEALGQYLPKNDELVIYRELLENHNHIENLVKTIVHESAHRAQYKGGKPLTSSYNPVTGDYLDYRNEIPKYKLEKVLEIVDKHYHPDVRLIEEIAFLAEDKELWDHPAFVRITQNFNSLPFL